LPLASNCWRISGMTSSVLLASLTSMKSKGDGLSFRVPACQARALVSAVPGLASAGVAFLFWSAMGTGPQREKASSRRGALALGG
jgi:hypothetical protein